jgi:hypothetical protein
MPNLSDFLTLAFYRLLLQPVSEILKSYVLPVGGYGVGVILFEPGKRSSSFSFS